jgi:hypothetical protein
LAEFAGWNYGWSQIEMCAPFRLSGVCCLFEGENGELLKLLQNVGLVLLPRKNIFNIDWPVNRAVCSSFQKKPKEEFFLLQRSTIWLGIANYLLNGKYWARNWSVWKAFNTSFTGIYAHSHYYRHRLSHLLLRTASQIEIDFVLGITSCVEVKATDNCQTQTSERLRFAEEMR